MTVGSPHEPAGDRHEDRPLVDAALRVEQDERLDRAVDLMARPARIVSGGRARELLSGRPLGHALHPLMTDLPLGCWLSAGLLDVFGGRAARSAAQRLVGMGVLLAIPTAATGLSDWGVAAQQRDRRVGVVHAALNVVALSAYVWSWSLRRRGMHLRGGATGVCGGLIATASGYLGGHMSFRRRVGTGDPAMDGSVRAAA